MNANSYALLVEDDPNTAQLVDTILKQHDYGLKIEHVTDGEQALDFLHGRGAFDGRDGKNPAVLLIDLEMPRMDGLEFLREVKADARLRLLPVVVMAGSVTDAKVQQCYELGANAFVLKPVNYQQFADFMRTIGEFWLTINQPPRVRPPTHKTS